MARRKIPTYVFRQGNGLPMRGGPPLDLPGESPGAWCSGVEGHALLRESGVVFRGGPVLYAVEYRSEACRTGSAVFAKSARLLRCVNGWNIESVERARAVLLEMATAGEISREEIANIRRRNAAIPWWLRVGDLAAQITSHIEGADPVSAVIDLFDLDGTTASPIAGYFQLRADPNRPRGLCRSCGMPDVCSRRCLSRRLRLRASKNQWMAANVPVAAGSDERSEECHSCGALAGVRCHGDCPGFFAVDNVLAL